jgi:hypothetical protein
VSATTESFVRQLADLSPALAASLDEHINDNFGELLPHVFLGDVTRHLAEIAHTASSADVLAVRRELKSALETLELAYASGNEEVQELIAASFLENLPAPHQPGWAIRQMVGPKLGSQLKKMA